MTRLLILLLPVILLLGGCAGQKPAKRSIEELAQNTGAAQSSYANATPDDNTRLLGVDAATGRTHNYLVSAIIDHFLAGGDTLTATLPVKVGSANGFTTYSIETTGLSANQAWIWNGTDAWMAATIYAIDDTKGNGDTGYTWSADKVYDQLALKAASTDPVFTGSLAVPQGSSPAVDAAGEIAIDTTSDQFVYYGGAKRVLTYKQREPFALKSPVDADDFLLFQATTAISITGLRANAQGGGSITVTLQKCDADGSTNCTNIGASVTADGGTDVDATIDSPSIAADEWIKMLNSAPTGTVNYLSGSVLFVETAD